ncbi:DUF1573 domain-containing protein [Porphyromonas gingivicanis]|uniref:DUF1573 domain-containing protein n=1 Tax=Porphyromonas gingivicanis TaxID=266762 RepID=UPI000470B0D1|nr:DUF1573 domain-containing protein [Porphyromonas gingivicanis]
MEKIRICYLFLLLILGLKTHASYAQKQNPVLVLTDTVHNFGNIAEEKGLVTATFSFINEGTIPLIITQVTTDCGCTTSSYTQEAIAPGKKGSVQVVYNPAGRPGPFVRTVRIYSNANKVAKALVKGVVTTLGGANSKKYTHSIGELQLGNKELYFSIITDKKRIPLRLEVQNSSLQPLRVKIVKAPSFLSFDKKEFLLASKEPDEIEITPKMPTTKRSALYQGDVVVEVSDLNNVKRRGSVRVTMPFLQSSDLALEKSPKLNLNTYQDLGVVEPGISYKGFVELENEGEKELFVYGVVSENEVVKINSFDSKIKSGKKGRIAYTIETRKIGSGKEFSTNISLLVNDPSAPLRKVKVLIRTLNTRKN